ITVCKLVKVSWSQPDNGTVTVKVGDDVITSESKVHVGSVLDITISVDEGYQVESVTVSPDSDPLTPEDDGSYQYIVGNDFTGDSITITVSIAETKEATYSLVTSLNQLEEGKQVIIACNTKDKVAGALGSNVLASVDATFNNDKSSIDDKGSALILTLGKSGDNWTFANSEGKLLGCTAEKKVAFGSGTTAWTIEVSAEGVATIKSTTQTPYAMQFNASAPRFAPYKSSQTAIQLYVLQ
ncbi:MAG: hypothetical protein NC099_06500, partial [Corallococcus sp.]|nr:hypothetical protein [Corallococcus sp.]